MEERPRHEDWFAFMDKYHHVESTNNSAAVYGYGAAEALTQVLKQCGDDLSRENIVRQAASLRSAALRCLAQHLDDHIAPTTICRSSRCGLSNLTAVPGSPSAT